MNNQSNVKKEKQAGGIISYVIWFLTSNHITKL